jgi:integrase/recombinase XerD
MNWSKPYLKRRQNGSCNMGEERHPKAQRLAQASAHWLRHTAGSHMANYDLDLRFVCDNLGHQSLNTTSGYLHSSDDERHRAIEGKHKISW